VPPRSSQTRSCSVSQEWRKPLSGEKSDCYVRCLQNLENAYGMFSVSLDDALGMVRRGKCEVALEMLSLSPALCGRLSQPLRCLLGTMEYYARHFGVVPNVVPLNPGNFQSPRSQRVARFNELISRVLLRRKSQFVSKISTLEELVKDLEVSFGATSVELTDDQSVEPERDWELLDAMHYDLNTCLRETAILYKSFLHALPDEQLECFEGTLRSRCEAVRERVSARTRHLAHGRMAFLKGQ